MLTLPPPPSPPSPSLPVISSLTVFIYINIPLQSLQPFPLCTEITSSSICGCWQHRHHTSISVQSHWLLVWRAVQPVLWWHAADSMFMTQRQTYLEKGSSCWLYKPGSPTQKHFLLSVEVQQLQSPDHASSRTHPTALCAVVAEGTNRPCQIKNEVIILLKVAIIRLPLQIMWSNEKSNSLKGINTEATVFFFFFPSD